MAPSANAQPGTLSVRQAVAANTAATDDGVDGSTAYPLQRLLYRELTSAELGSSNATLADVYRVWTVSQTDLDNVGAPTPAPMQTLTVNGVVWVIERVSQSAMNQAYEMTCRQTH